MKNKRYIIAFLIITMLLTQMNVWAGIGTGAKAAVTSEDVVLRWNRVLMETVSTPGQHPATIMPVRSYAIMHAAMFDAVNSIDRTYTPYLSEVPAIRGASIEAAAAQAAHDVLVALYPGRSAVFGTELAQSLNAASEFRVRQGRLVGQMIAQRILAARSNDGWGVTPPAYTLPPTPGNWQPTPPANSPATFTHYPAVTPFAITSSSQFMPPPPPSITSAEYARDLNEVKELGSATSTTRTADQTLVARLWANVGTPTNFLFVWNNVARTVSIDRGLSVVEKARLFALTNIALHDALQSSFASKFEFGTWRPVTAIRRSDEDGNAATTPDVNWTPLLGTPPYPSYAGNMASLTASQATVLALFFGRDDIRFDHTWEGSGGATRSYQGFAAMADEAARSRVYGGIHFNFDNEAGKTIGRSVGIYVFQNLMRPRGCVQ
jgi:hypothetical protein